MIPQQSMPPRHTNPAPPIRALQGTTPLWVILLALLTLFIGDPRADGESFVSVGRKVPVGARSLALAEAVTSNPGDYSTLYYNPAGMLSLGSSEAGFGLRYNYFTQRTFPASAVPDHVEGLQLNSAHLILSDGQAWALGVGLYTPVMFDDALSFPNGNRGTYRYLADGGLNHFRVAVAHAISPMASFGLAASSIFGSEELEIQDSLVIRYREEYEGFNLEPALLLSLSEQARFGFSAVLWEHLFLDDTWQIKGGEPNVGQYSIRHPMQLKAGLTVESGGTHLSFEWRGDYWSTYRYSLSGAGFAAENPYMPNRHRLQLGLEHYLRDSPLILRAGLGWEVEDKPDWDDRNTPLRWAAGFGYHPQPHLAMDVGYQYGADEELLPGGTSDARRMRRDHHQLMGALRFFF